MTKRCYREERKQKIEPPPGKVINMTGLPFVQGKQKSNTMSKVGPTIESWKIVKSPKQKRRIYKKPSGKMYEGMKLTRSTIFSCIYLPDFDAFRCSVLLNVIGMLMLIFQAGRTRLLND